MRGAIATHVALYFFSSAPRCRRTTLRSAFSCRSLNTARAPRRDQNKTYGHCCPGVGWPALTAHHGLLEGLLAHLALENALHAALGLVLLVRFVRLGALGPRVAGAAVAEANARNAHLHARRAPRAIRGRGALLPTRDAPSSDPPAACPEASAAVPVAVPMVQLRAPASLRVTHRRRRPRQPLVFAACVAAALRDRRSPEDQQHAAAVRARAHARMCAPISELWHGLAQRRHQLDQPRLLRLGRWLGRSHA